MSKALSDALMLYGTDEPITPMQICIAGPLSAQFDQGALRYVRVNGVEAIRNIAFVVRDKDWGTCSPEISKLQIESSSNGFSISYDAACKNNGEEIRYQATITGQADGRLSFIVDYEPTTDFETNRTGFVVLHPLEGIAGCPVSVEHVDGSIVESEFPALVDPVQPFKNIRALTHTVEYGVSVCCRMTGDAYEMEDHRQWNDASYKTYVRPLADPRPYRLAAGQAQQQSVSLTVIDSRKDASPARDIGVSTTIQEDITTQAPGIATPATKPVLTSRSTDNDAAAIAIDDVSNCIISIDTSQSAGVMPRIGLGLEPRHNDSALTHQALLCKLGIQQLVVWHELDKHNVDELEQAVLLGQSTGAKLVLHAVIPDKDYQAEVTELASQCSDAGMSLEAISVTPVKYLQSITPGASWPDVTSLNELYGSVRAAFPGVRVGGGMLSFFPELNRHRPPLEHIDYVTHASNTITHASDDVTVTENLQAIPFIARTCRSFSADKPYEIGPSSIGMRFNPYGSKTIDNPDNTRVAMTRAEPRHRGLFNAAWTVGYAANFARQRVDCINLHAPTGEFGVIYQAGDWLQPGFDNSNKRVYPVFHIIAGLAQACGKPQLQSHSSMSREVAVIAYQDGAKCVIWLSNLTHQDQQVVVKGLSDTTGNVAELSLTTFQQHTEQPDGMKNIPGQSIDTVLLTPYAVLRITTSI